MDIKIQNEDDNKVNVVLTGRLDTLAATQIADDIQLLVESADHEIDLDCKNLEYISSSGLRHILLLRKETHRKGGKLIIRHINDELRNIFTITGFISILDIRP